MGNPENFIERLTSIADIDRVLALQKATHCADPYPDVRVRRDRLERLLELIRKNYTFIEDSISEDFGYRSKDETYAFEVLSCVEEIRRAENIFLMQTLLAGRILRHAAASLSKQNSMAW